MGDPYVSYVSAENARIVPSPALEAVIESARRAQRLAQQRHDYAKAERLRELGGWQLVGQGSVEDDGQE